MDDDLEYLDHVLREADEAHAQSVAALAKLGDDELAYLAGVDELEDPLSDGLEGRCPA